VHLLPALPQAWPEGEVKGLVMRGGFVVDMRWAEGQIRELKIHSRLGGNLRLRTHSLLPAVNNFKVKKITGNGKNPNPYYQQAQIKKPLKNTTKAMPQLSLANAYLVDVTTEAGHDYVWGASQ
jgi:alpha-L-fucosidase 2